MKMRMFIVIACLTIAFGAALAPSLYIRRLQSVVEIIASPGYGTCYRCNRPWKFAEEHITDYEFSENMWIMNGVSTPMPLRGCFPLCKDCWTELGTPQARLPYYHMLVDKWKQQTPAYADDYEKRRALIVESVLAGR